MSQFRDVAVDMSSIVGRDPQVGRKSSFFGSSLIMSPRSLQMMSIDLSQEGV